MYQNPDKYDSTLQNLIRKVYNASPLFQQRINQLKFELTHYSDLCKKEEKLNQKKADQIKLLQNGFERCRQVRETHENSVQQYLTVKSKLKDAVYKEAILAIKNGKNPLIYSKLNAQDKTMLVQSSRINSRLILLKANMMKEFDQLCELQQNVYCLDEISNTNNINFLLNNNFNDFPEKSSEFFATQLLYKKNDSEQKTSQYILDHFQAQYQPQSQNIPQKPITQISKSISSKINQIKSNNLIPLYFASFKPQQLQKETRNIKFNSFLSKVASNFDKIIGSDQELKEKIYLLFQEISTLYQKRHEILSNFYQSKQEFTPVKILSCINILINSSESLRKTQTLIETLNALITTNGTIPRSIWSNEHQIRFKMNQLLNSIDNITNLLSKTQKYAKLDKFGYQEIREQYVIEEVSQTQIDQCKDLISELQVAFTNLEKEKIASLEEIDDTIKLVTQIKQNKKDDEDDDIFLNKHDKEFNPSMTDLSHIEDEHLPEILQARASLLDKQNAELQKLMEIIKTIPDELKEVSFDREDLDFKFKPPPTIQLPPVTSYEEDESTHSSQIFSVSSSTDDISERNAKCIEEIKAKNYGHVPMYSFDDQNNLESTANDNDAISITSKQNLKVVRNERLESIFASLQPKSNPFHSSSRYHALLEKKNHLIAHIEDLSNKLDYVKKLESEIENMERPIKNFPIFKGNNMKNLNRNKKIIDDLREQIEEKENSDEYKQYKSICDSIEVARKEFEELE